jgi:hypothetical protein
MDEDDEQEECIHLIFPKESCTICNPYRFSLKIEGAEELGTIKFTKD